MYSTHKVIDSIELPFDCSMKDVLGAYTTLVNKYLKSGSESIDEFIHIEERMGKGATKCNMCGETDAPYLVMVFAPPIEKK